MSSKETQSGYESEVVVERLISWGFEGAKYLKKDGELDLNEYSLHLRERFLVDGNLGELTVHSLMSGFGKPVRIGAFSAPMGFGHHRLSRYYETLLKTVGLDVIHVDLGASGEGPKFMEFFKYLKTAYINGSNRNGVQTGLSFDYERLTYVDKTFVSKMLQAWENHAPDHFYNTMMGKPGKHLTPASTRRTFRFLDRVFGEEFRSYLTEKGITHHLVLYPMINSLVDNQKTILVGTDSVLEPAGWIPEPRLIVETEFAKAKILKAWKGDYSEKVLVSNGFPAPIVGLAQSNELVMKRAQALENGQPLVLILPASGVATAQLRSFSEILVETASLVSAGKLKIIVQTGAEELGKRVYESLSTLVVDLSEEFVGYKENVILHYGKTVEAALDLFEVLAGSNLPMVVAVKGSEMSRIAVQLGMPHIATGTIGEHEKWNVIVSAIQGAAVSISSAAYFECRNLIESDAFPREYYWVARNALERNYSPSMIESLSRAELMIKERIYPDTNRQMMVDSLTTLLNS